MATPIIVQTPDAFLASAAATAKVTFLSAIAAGNSLIGGVTLQGSLARSWTVGDTTNGAASWTQDLLYQPGQSFAIHHFHSSAAGSPDVTWTINTSTWTGWVAAVEVSGLNTAASPTTGSHDETPATATGANVHACNGVNGATTATNMTGTDVFVIALGCLTAAASTCTAGTGYAAAPTLSSTRHMIEYKAVASLNDAGTVSETGTARIWQGCMAVYAAPTGGGGGTTTKRLSALGVG